MLWHSTTKLNLAGALSLAFTGGVDGRRSLAHCSLVRHYLNQCGSWKILYRLVMGILRKLISSPTLILGCW